MNDGVLLIDKPAGMTSAKVVALLKQRLGFRKIGHAGTLDPMATGLLVCLINSATKFAGYAVSGDKVYSGSIDLGISTDTDDIEGAVISRSDRIPAFEQVQAELAEFTGELQQVPPQVSAVKVNGVRSYALARQGLAADLKSRPVTVHSFEIGRLSDCRISYRIHCSKGTYIRSLARDLGEKLGCGACLSGLRREFSSPFSVDDAGDLDQVSLDDLRAWWDLFPDSPRLSVSQVQAQRLKNGDQDVLNEVTQDLRAVSAEQAQSVYVNRESGESLGLLVYRSGRWNFGVNMR